MKLTEAKLKKLILEAMEDDGSLIDAIMDRLNEAIRIRGPAAEELINSTINLGASLGFFNEPHEVTKNAFSSGGRRVIVVDYRGDPEGFTKFGSFLKDHSDWLDVSNIRQGFGSSGEEAPETRGIPAFTPLFNVSFMLFSPADIGN